jgi:RNA polymerase sigma-70 factor (family 1)
MLTLSHSEDAILKALKAGDEGAFLQIYDTHWYRIFLIAYKRLGEKSVAEELTQDLFMKLWEKRESLEPQNIGNYLSVAIKNAVIDHIHAGLVANKYLDFCKAFSDANANATEHVVEFHQLSEDVRKGLSQLPEKTQMVFKLSRLDGWKSEKIASHLKLSEKTVGYHLTRSLKFMRTYLREYLLLTLLFASF